MGRARVYDNAQARVVVGEINLVEKIADLARRPPPTSFRTANAEDREKMKESFQNVLVLTASRTSYAGRARRSVEES